MSDFLDTPVGSMNFRPPHPKDGPAATAPKPGGTPSPGTTTPPPSHSGFSFAPTYQDYLGYYGKGGDGAFSEAQWNALGSAGQWHNLGDGFSIGPDDPRYAALAQQLGITDGGVIVFGSGDAPLNAGRVNGRTSFVDPNGVLQGDGMWATAHSNLTPEAEFSGGGLSDRGWVIAAGSLLAGGALAGGAIGGAAGASTGAGIEGGIGTGADIAGAGVVGGEGAVGGAAGAVPTGEIVGPPASLAPDPTFAAPPGGDFGPPAALAPDPAAVAVPPGGGEMGPPASLAPDPIAPPGGDIMGPPADLAPTPPPSAVADGLTPSINDLVSPPPIGGGEFTPSPGGGLDYSPTLPSTPDFNVPLQPPPDVSVPSPDIPDSPWYAGAIDNITSHPLQAAGLGMTAFNALHRPKPPGINSNIPDTNKPVIDQAITDIKNKGQLSPDQQHSIDGIIDRHIREGVEAINQRSINSGMGANSMVTQQQVNQFKQNAETVRAQLYQQQMQQNIGNAIAIWSEGNREDIAIQTAAAQLASENNREIAALNVSIAQSLGWLSAMGSSRNAPTPAPGG